PAGPPLSASPLAAHSSARAAPGLDHALQTRPAGAASAPASSPAAESSPAGRSPEPDPAGSRSRLGLLRSSTYGGTIRSRLDSPAAGRSACSSSPSGPPAGRGASPPQDAGSACRGPGDDQAA